MSLTYNIKSEDGITIVSFDGKIISSGDTETIAAYFNQLDSKQITNTIFDFDSLSHINSSGINFMIRTLTKLRINNSELVLCNVAGNVRSLFEIAKIDTIFSVFDSKTEAINHFKPSR